MRLGTLLAVALPLSALAQDPPRLREYDVDALVRPLRDSGAPYLGMLHGATVDGVPEPEMEPANDVEFPTLSPDLVGDLVKTLTAVEWDEEKDSIELTPQRKLLINAPDEIHKRVARIVPTLAARLAPEIAVDATIVEIRAGVLGEIVSGVPAVLPDERAARLQDAIRQGVDAGGVRRLRLAARPLHLAHVKSVEDTAYLADVDLVAAGDKPAYKSVTASVRTGVTLEVRAHLYDGAVVLDWRLAEARLDGAPGPSEAAKGRVDGHDTIETAGGTQIQMPRVRRRSMNGELLVPNTATAFAGAVPAAGRPGWVQAVFLRPQVEAPAMKEKPWEPEGAMVLALHPVSAICETGEGGAPLRMTGDDLCTLVRSTVEPGEWDEATGASLGFNDGLLLVHNTPSVQKKVAAFLAERRRDLAAVAVELKLVRATAGALGEAALGESLSARTIEKLLAKAAAGDGASVAWEAVVSSATRRPVAVDDRWRRPIVASYPIESGAPDPQLGVAEWGARLALTPVAPEKAGGRIALRGLKLDFATAAEPFARTAASGKLEIHLPKIATAGFAAECELEPGVWTSLGMAASGDATLVLLARASAP